MRKSVSKDFRLHVRPAAVRSTDISRSPNFSISTGRQGGESLLDPLRTGYTGPFSEDVWLPK
jgi:hypothetical protein